jgi:hypothetical protein
MKKEVKEENKQPDKKSINNVYEQFIRNIESVEAFFETFSLKAIEEDKSILESRTEHLENAILKTFS